MIFLPLGDFMVGEFHSDFCGVRVKSWKELVHNRSLLMVPTLKFLVMEYSGSECQFHVGTAL